MELKTGYKLTEVGVIPEEWSVFPLSKIVEGLDAGISVNSISNDSDKGFGEKRVLKTSCVSNGTFKPEEAKTILPEDESRARLNPTKGSIIISRMNTPELVGECGYVFETFPNLFLPDRLWQFRFKRDSLIDSKWLSVVLSYSAFKKSIKDSATGTSGSMKNISKSSLIELLIPFPPYKEQAAIANVLNDIDALISSLESLIAKKRNIKQGAMQKLLQPKEDWMVKKFKDKDVTELITCGIAATPEYVSEVEGYPFLSSTNVKGGKIVWDNFKYINKQLHKQLYRNNPPLKGDILYSRVGTIGEAAIIDVDFEFSVYVSLTLIKTGKLLYNGFLVQLLNSPKYKKLANSTVLMGGGVGNLNVNVVREFEIPIPPMNEQVEIATILSDMDLEIATLEDKLEKYKQIRQGMMQNLLTGKIRLIKKKEPLLQDLES